jgi:hypothetical protein
MARSESIKICDNKSIESDNAQTTKVPHLIQVGNVVNSVDEEQILELCFALRRPALLSAIFDV